MSNPRVSVIIPAYNQAQYLGDAIESVLQQTYANLELIIVNDASPDQTTAVVERYHDARIKYIIHPQNRGLPATRNTGIRASTGELIAHLDADDAFHPEKLATHVRFLETHPVEVTYNGRFDWVHSAQEIGDIVRPPRTVTLSDLVLGFPFSPSDVVVRRKALEAIGLFDESFAFFGEDLNMNCRLALAGYKIASVDRVLGYRRRYANRVIRDLVGGLNSIFRAFDGVFADPRCPREVQGLRDRARVIKYLGYACFAFGQKEFELARQFIRAALALDPAIVQGHPCELISMILDFGTADENADHQAHLTQVFAELPSELSSLRDQTAWAIARGSVLKGIRATMWNRPAKAKEFFAQARAHDAQVDEALIHQVAFQLASYEKEFGVNSCLPILDQLYAEFKQLSGVRCANQLNGQYAVNSAFEYYQTGQYAPVPGRVMRAIASDPRYLTNRGILSIFLRSLRYARQTHAAVN